MPEAPVGAPVKPRSRKRTDEQALVVQALCKTYAATTTKMLYAFSALSEIHTESESEKASSVNAALASSGRALLIDQMAATLSAAVEKIIRSPDVSMRSAVLRDLRVRFAPKMPTKQAEFGCQTDTEPLAKQQRVSSAESFSTYAADEEAHHTAGPPSAAAPGDVHSIETASVEPPPGSAGTDTGAAQAGISRGMYDRLKAWEARKEARLEMERKKAVDELQKELEKRSTRPAAKLYTHVESVIKKERIALENARVAQAEAIAHEALMAKEHAERVAEHERLQASMSEEARREAEQNRAAALEAAHAARKEARRAEAKYQELVHDVERDKKARADVKEIADALNGREFESWPMLPGKKVLRVKEAEEFDGRISAEFRCKDDESGERGVSLLMGRVYSTRAVEPQCVLFDETIFSDLDAARWWAKNAHRKCFELSKTGQMLQRARSGSSRNQPYTV
jgi:hypothetical protein